MPIASLMEQLLDTIERFAGHTPNTNDHPMFGRMDTRNWMRWGYLHADHHVRQFGR